MRTLTCQRFTLEPLLPEHAVAMFGVLSDPALYEFEREPPLSVRDLREHYADLATRGSPNGREVWLNWVLRLPTGELVGSVQATVLQGGQADIAYELASAHWSRGLATQAVAAMLDELVAQYGVEGLWAVLKRENLRSLRLLQRLGFTTASAEAVALRDIERDEWLMQRAPMPT
ncbi:MAG: GNAT family N-acetyltransferase [Burkholderiales bacterium]|nr:GNAT family N-acetyltransferase [Burkholderiales bacterium]